METIRRKRKLNEIDVNIPLFHGSILQDGGGKFSVKPKPQFIATPSDGCENIVSLPKDVDGLENSKLEVGDARKYDKITKSEGRHHMKSCDRRYRKAVQQDEKPGLQKIGLPVDVNQSKEVELCDLSQNKVQNLVQDPNLKSDFCKRTALNSINNAEAREMRMWFNYEYFEDILAYELQKEKKYKLSKDFCKKFDIDPERREILIDWLVSVQIHLGANNNTLHLAVSLLDILLDKVYIPYKLLQVSAIAAFWVAYKFIHGNLNVKILISLCAGIPTRDMILDHEILVLESSDLLQAGGDVSTFFNYLLYQLFGHSYPPEIYYSGQYFLEIMLMHFMFVDCSASERAITAVYAALTIFDSPLRVKLFEFGQFITRKKLKLLCYHLVRLLKLMYSDEENLKKSCLFRKYKSSRYFKISSHEILKELSTVKTFDYYLQM